ncbi:hypothetical protein CEXT_32931 [Caerostris extrusa]|uniref:Uncharacterized protein n=1 Tax=Caerostris extrusa TaxID=172846 RepID=A0AAV4PJN7_CAEEX|nr:hypothetical protein CEXT_32931 [Caerostris extrusa]
MFYMVSDALYSVGKQIYSEFLRTATLDLPKHEWSILTEELNKDETYLITTGTYIPGPLILRPGHLINIRPIIICTLRDILHYMDKLK